jgi:hypothetical protein
MRGTCMMAAAGVLAAASVASADFLAIDLNFEFSGATAPSGSAPWLRAEFSSSTAGEVDLKLISLLHGDNEKITKWTFNLDPALSATGLNVTHDGGQAPASVSKGVDAFKADGDGYFDLLFSFPTSGNTFGKGETAEFTITSADPITAASFAYLSVNGPPSKNGFMSAAHVQGIGPGGGQSGWIAPTMVPLPAPVALGGAGLALAAGMGAWRRRR